MVKFYGLFLNTLDEHPEEDLIVISDSPRALEEFHKKEDEPDTVFGVYHAAPLIQGKGNLPTRDAPYFEIREVRYV